MKSAARREKFKRYFKEKYQDRIIFQTTDEFGTIQVVEEDNFRSLHFDSFEKQSSIDLGVPNTLSLSYTQSMLAGFLFRPRAKKFLCIGLGGGSIPKFLLDQVKDCQIDVIELRQSIVQIAFDYFLLPADDQRLTVYVDDASNIIEEESLPQYDMIIIDAFEEDGISESVINQGFLSLCEERLGAGGVLSINFWSEPKSIYKKIMKRLKTVFNQRILDIPVEERTNRIAFGISPPLSLMSQEILKKRADLLQKRFNLDFKNFFDQILKHNRSTLKKLNLE
mgnify:CR=1 FL=1